MTDEERAYNSDQFTAAAPAAMNPGETMAVKVGLAAPEFEASTLDGAIIRLSDFRGSRHVVMMTGAVTSPMCAFEIPAFNQLQQDFHGRGVSFFLLYTRESHPAENYGPHHSFEQKLSYARDLRRLEKVQFPIIVDHLDGRIHRAYGVWPNALFVIHRDGRLIFRSNMANDRELRQFLQDLLGAEKAAAEGQVTHWQYSERILPHVADQATHRRIYERAGQKAFEDYWAKRPVNRNRWP
ncbi:MAG: peroxiredoxin family protein [Chloroflexota bacterium]